VIDLFQTHDMPPATRVIDATNGSVVGDVAVPDTTKFGALGLKKAELFTYTAADGKKLLEIPTGQSGMGPPITYELDGRQYISFMGGTGQAVTCSGTITATFTWVGPGLPHTT
jgi:hypothetical protein